VSSRVKERDLPKHLRGSAEEAEPDADEKAADGDAKPQDKEEGKAELASRDYALFEALNLLKGLTILRKAES